MTALTDLGLSEYEARTYRSLLDLGPATAKELSEASGVPMGRIYDVLGSLESQHLARSRNASRPKRYAPVDPGTGLGHLLEERRRELEARAEQYESVVDDLVRDLETPTAPDSGFWTAALGADDTVDLLVDRIDDAGDRICILSGNPTPGFDLGEVSDRILDHLVDALDRGVRVEVLVGDDLSRDLPADVEGRYREAIEANADFEFRRGPAGNHDVTVLDETEVCLELPNPVTPDQPFALIDLTDPAFAADVLAEFDRAWQAASPLEA